MIKMFRNVVRGFSLVLHDPEGSHYKIWRWRISQQRQEGVIASSLLIVIASALPCHCEPKARQSQGNEILNPKSEILNNIKWPKSRSPSSGFRSCLIHQAQLPNKLGNYIFEPGIAEPVPSKTRNPAPRNDSFEGGIAMMLKLKQPWSPMPYLLRVPGSTTSRI